MTSIQITTDNFEKEVLQSQDVVLLDFYADWCGPCRMVAPVLEQIAQENPHVKVCKINVDENMELATRFQVTSIPLLVVMKDGKMVNQALGARPKEQILAMLP